MPCGLKQGSQRCVPKKAHCALGTILDSKLLSFKRKPYLISFLLQHKVIPQPLGNSGTSQKTNEGKITQKSWLFSSSQPTGQLSMPVSANMTPSGIRRLVDVNQIKCIHFGHVAIFSSTGLIIALVEFRPFPTMSDFEFNQWDELSQFSFCKRRFTNLIATNGALLEGFMFAIGWHKCSMKNEQFGQSLQYFGDNLFQKIQNCYNSLGVPSFDQVNYEGDITANQGAFKFSSALTFTLNGFKNSPHLDMDALLYASGWWFQADKRTGQVQQYASKRCTGGKLIFPNEHFWIDLSRCHGLIQVV
ncbi:hypothetical protein O181_022233 [Austropuccinia psidii MF-1]|uniref:Tet-like 2OG-Fe(II) oxygenase domain-containing protein n=1 Tax=Austropuccinia psidii MF-1 TaxID=1389203 RepID=A0A9Q3CGF6_9BASI|nr:hypothetical protein [Austropuccinia psidii MF-1]